jgi:MarR family transcriptional regulator, organic hydroperoxide resistance regulator
MMRTGNLLKELIEMVGAFDAAVPEGEELTMAGFADYLNRQPLWKNDDRAIINISKNVSLLHRYSKFYLKKVLKDSTLQTIDEYSYLICLFQYGSLTKTELNNINAMEKTSGNEVIRRLVKSHLITQQPDDTDKRSIRVSITKNGEEELNRIFPGLKKAAVILSENLADGEKENLDRFLSKLCDYHHFIFTERRNDDIDEIIKD